MGIGDSKDREYEQEDTEDTGSQHCRSWRCWATKNRTDVGKEREWGIVKKIRTLSMYWKGKRRYRTELPSLYFGDHLEKKSSDDNDVIKRVDDMSDQNGH